MSYENWAECPRCRWNDDEQIKRYHDIVENQYGIVDKNVYLNALNGIATPNSLHKTLQEIWEIGIVWDDFFVQYSASCDVCGYSYSFQRTEDLK